MQEAKALEERFGAAWAGGIATRVKHFQFERGFVGLVGLTAREFLESAPELFSLAPIQHVDLTAVRGSGEDLFDSPHLLRLRSLGMNLCRLVDQDIRLLAASPNVRELRWLSLTVNYLGMPAAEALARSRNLPNLGCVVFAGNDADPTQQFAWDQGIVADTWMPEQGEKLESAYRPLDWLHCEAKTADDYPPNRFVLAAA